MKAKYTILGDGGWGTTLAVHLAKNGYPVTLWGAFASNVRRIRQNRYNAKYLPGIHIPKTVTLQENLKQAVEKADVIVLAIPSQYAVSVLRKLKKLRVSQKVFLSVIKGIDTTTLLRMSQVIKHHLGPIRLAVLSGPTIAMEVAQGIPSSAVIASTNGNVARRLQAAFNSPTFRIYTNRDVIGVELGGSLKNVIALACGVCDGLGYGTNTKAAILSRGLAEISRLGVTLGAKAKTFAGLTGLGDLVTTCVSPRSRNRFVGEQLGKGKSIRQITSKMIMVAEGVPTVKAVVALSKRHSVSMPISAEVYNIIYKKKKPLKAVGDLMTRAMKAE